VEQELYQAYIKLKSYLVNDKTLLQEKIDLARFEENININIEELSKTIINKDISQWIDSINYTLVPKKLKKDNVLSENIYTNKTIQDKYEIESYNIFIKAPIEIHLISVLWTMLIGNKLDNELRPEVKGNRLFRDKKDKFKNESYKLFKPYFEGYQSFRDDGIEKAINLHKLKFDVTLINLDITEFYYNIKFNFYDLPSDIKDKYSLNSLMQEIHKQYHTVLTNDNIQPKEDGEYKQENFLPIGFVSSSIIANFILNDFDNDIITNLKPEYYSRYVDDMIMVFSNSNIDINDKYSFCKLLKCRILNTTFSCSKNPNSFTTNKRKFIFQQEKVKVFQFYKNDSIIVLKKFKETIDKNSSFFNFMPDDEKLFDTLENSANMLFYSDSENKVSSLIGTTKDTLKISRNLTGVISTVSSAKFDKEHFKNYNQQLKNIFSGKEIFTLRLHWLRVFEYLIVIGDKELFKYFYEEFYTNIKSLEHKNQKNKLIKDMKKYLINCIKFAKAMKNCKTKTKDILVIKKANIFSQHNMSYPLINFCQNINDINFLTHNIEFKNFDFTLDIKKIKYSPRFIHYHEIILFYFIKMINKKAYFSNYSNFFRSQYKKLNQLKNINKENFPIYKNNTFIIKSDEENYNKDKLKIAIVSIKVKLDDIVKSYLGKSNLQYKRLQDLFDILNESIRKNENKPDIILFPEVSIPYAWIHLFSRFAKKNSIGIIFGIEHIKINKVVSNYTCIMLPFVNNGHTSLFINFDLKKHYSPDEQIEIEGHHLVVNENEKLNPILYKWRGAVFTTFNCFELTDIGLRSNLAGKIDFMVVSEYNKDTNYFSNIIESTARDLHCYIIQVNTSDYGDSRIVQPTKTEKQNIVRIKGGKNLYLVIDDINIKSLREFQAKTYFLQKQEKDIFKLTPPNFKISDDRID
jgi:hypothetical protein